MSQLLTGTSLFFGTLKGFEHQLILALFTSLIQHLSHQILARREKYRIASQNDLKHQVFKSPWSIRLPMCEDRIEASIMWTLDLQLVDYKGIDGNENDPTSMGSYSGRV